MHNHKTQRTNTKSKIIIEVFNSKWTGKPLRGELRSRLQDPTV
jgi:hypothetical protein